MNSAKVTTKPEIKEAPKEAPSKKPRVPTVADLGLTLT